MDENTKAGIEEIDSVKWVADSFGVLNLYVHDKNHQVVHAFLAMRPQYCDRGHMQLLINGDVDLDWADSFPRFFFSFREADEHTRLFLKWRLWKYRVHPHAFNHE